MKILVVGGMHGNEPLGLQVIKLFEDTPVERVETVLANEPAIAANVRFVTQDLNRSFPGDLQSESYESRRAARLVELSKGYDVVLDFHNTFCPDNDCGFIGVTADPVLTDVAWVLGLDKLIVADYDCLNKAADNCLSIEISLDSLLNDAQIWYDRIVLLSRLDTFTTKPDIKRYKFVYRMTLEDKDRLRLPMRDLRAFKAMDEDIADDLGVEAPAYPIFIDDQFTPYNYGGVLNELSD